MSTDLTRPVPPACCGKLEAIAESRAWGWQLKPEVFSCETCLPISFCPVCGAFLGVDGQALDEPGLPMPTAEMIEAGKEAYRGLAAWNRAVMGLLGALDARAKRRRA